MATKELIITMLFINITTEFVIIIYKNLTTILRDLPTFFKVAADDLCEIFLVDLNLVFFDDYI